MGPKEKQRSEDWGTFYVRPAKMGNGQPWPEFEEAKSAYQMRMALETETEIIRTGWVQLDQTEIVMPKIRSDQQLRLKTSPYTANHLEALTNLDLHSLYRLDLNDLENQGQLHYIASLTQLKVLDLQEANLSDKGTIHLARFK